MSNILLTSLRWKVDDQINGFGRASKDWYESHSPDRFTPWSYFRQAMNGEGLNWSWGTWVTATLGTIALISIIIAIILYAFKLKLKIRGRGIFSRRESTLGPNTKELELFQSKYFKYSFISTIAMFSIGGILLFTAFFVNIFVYGDKNIPIVWAGVGLIIGSAMMGMYCLYEIYLKNKRSFIRYSFNSIAAIGAILGAITIILLSIVTRTKSEMKPFKNGSVTGIEWGTLNSVDGKHDFSDSFITWTVCLLTITVICLSMWGVYLRRNSAKKTIRVFLCTLGILLFIGSLINSLTDTIGNSWEYSSYSKSTSKILLDDGYALFELIPFNAYCSINGMILGILLIFKKERYVYIVAPVAILGGISTWFVTDEMFDENIFGVSFWRFNILHGLLIGAPIIVIATVNQKFSINKLFIVILYWALFELFVGISLNNQSRSDPNYGPHFKKDGVYTSGGRWIWESRTFHERLGSLSIIQQEWYKAGVVFGCVMGYWLTYNFFHACGEVKFRANPFPIFARNMVTFYKQTLRTTKRLPYKFKSFVSNPEKKTFEDHESEGHWIKE